MPGADARQGNDLTALSALAQGSAEVFGGLERQRVGNHAVALPLDGPGNGGHRHVAAGEQVAVGSDKRGFRRFGQIGRRERRHLHAVKHMLGFFGLIDRSAVRQGRARKQDPLDRLSFRP